MNLAERYFSEFKKQSGVGFDLETINDNDFKIHLDNSGEFYVHVSIQDGDIDVEEHVDNLLKTYRLNLTRTDDFVLQYGEKHRKLITDSLDWADELGKEHGLTIDKKEFLESLFRKVK